MARRTRTTAATLPLGRPETFTRFRACRDLDSAAIRSLARSQWLPPQRAYSQAKAILCTAHHFRVRRARTGTSSDGSIVILIVVVFVLFVVILVLVLVQVMLELAP